MKNWSPYFSFTLGRPDFLGKIYDKRKCSMQPSAGGITGNSRQMLERSETHSRITKKNQDPRALSQCTLRMVSNWFSCQALGSVGTGAIDSWKLKKVNITTNYERFSIAPFCINTLKEDNKCTPDVFKLKASEGVCRVPFGSRMNHRKPLVYRRAVSREYNYLSASFQRTGKNTMCLAMVSWYRKHRFYTKNAY